MMSASTPWSMVCSQIITMSAETPGLWNKVEGQMPLALCTNMNPRRRYRWALQAAFNLASLKSQCNPGEFVARHLQDAVAAQDVKIQTHLCTRPNLVQFAAACTSKSLPAIFFVPLPLGCQGGASCLHDGQRHSIKCRTLNANARSKASQVVLPAPKLFANAANKSLIPVLSVRMFQLRHSKLSLIFAARGAASPRNPSGSTLQGSTWNFWHQSKAAQ